MQNTKLVLGVLVLLLFIAAAMKLNTMWHKQEALAIAALVKKQEQIDSLQARLYWNSMKRRMDFTPPLAKLEVSSPVGYRLNPMGGDIEALHKGIDLVGKIGTPVVAVLDGVVMEHWLVPGVHWGKRYYGHHIFGGMIVIKHSEGLYSIYGHLSQTQVHEGAFVKKGQKIGELGNTGISTGAHLHFELAVNPLEYLKTPEVK